MTTHHIKDVATSLIIFKVQQDSGKHPASDALCTKRDLNNWTKVAVSVGFLVLSLGVIVAPAVAAGLHPENGKWIIAACSVPVAGLLGTIGSGVAITFAVIEAKRNSRALKNLSKDFEGNEAEFLKVFGEIRESRYYN